MSQNQTVGIVSPEDVARKVAAIHNGEYPEMLEQITANPRLEEMLWFLQYMSAQPGGMVKFCEEMTQFVPDHFRTDTMRKIKPGPLSLGAKILIYDEIPGRYIPGEHRPGELEPGVDGLDELMSDGNPCDCTADFRARERADALGRGGSGLDRLETKEGRASLEKYFKTWTFDTFGEICRKAAIEVLPCHLAALCSDPDAGFKRDYGKYRTSFWFVEDLVATVLEMMARRASEVSKRLAMTAVTVKVFDALDYAFQERAMVQIVGDSRFGKTESVRAWCDMRPGRARLVSVPSSNSLVDLYRRIAEALGLEVCYRSRAQRVKERIEFVLQHSGMFIVLDEAAFLVPQNYTPATAPARLNWVRTEIVDRGLPLAVVVTPQSFLPAVNRFVKKTGYAMEQFFGRNQRVVQLPNELALDDMVAVARIHFPEMEDDYLALIADLAGVSENYLQAVEAIAKLARYIARRENHHLITIDDIEAAASEVVPRPAVAVTSESKEIDSIPSPEPVARADRTMSIRRVNAPFKTIARGVQPVESASSKGTILPVSSLRGAGPERVKTELVSAET